MSSDTRVHLLEAALGILEREGSSHLTIDAVARQAGVSKGGVLYHFPTKAALVEAMVRHHMALLDEEFERRIAAAEPGPGQVLRGWLDLFANRPPLTAERHLDLMSFIVRNPHLHRIIEEHRGQHQERLRSAGIDPDLALLLAFAAEGLGFAESFKSGLVNAALRGRLLDLARRLSFPGALNQAGEAAPDSPAD